MPACSVCGYAVEWLRACYASDWFLTAHSNVRTGGRYYFAPTGTPFYPDLHNLGSKQWHDKNVRYTQGLGEALDERFSFLDGSPPEVLPNVIQLGTSDCIASGESSDHLLNGELVFNGLPLSCFRGARPTSLTWEKAAAYDSCGLQAAYAQIIDWIYGADTVNIFAFLGSFLGPAWSLTYHRGFGAAPDCVTAISDEGSIVWLDGTDNFQQIALQAADLVAAPVDVGAFSTSLFWYANSDVPINALATAGADPFKPVFLCGHSYGGICAALAAARFRLGNPSRAVRWLTYGMPKIGDNRIVSILGTCPGRALCNDNDPVPGIAPNLIELLPALLVIAAPRFLVWPDWKSAPYQWRQDVLGAITPGATPILDTPFVIAFIAEILANLPHPTFSGHLLQTYIDRIFVRCPVEEWPLAPGDYGELFGGVFIAQENSFLILQEDGSRILVE